MELKFEDHSVQPLAAWASGQFDGAPLGDARRQKRLHTIGRRMAEEPGKTIPELFDRPYDVKAAYHFFDREEVTPENIQARHRETVRRESMRPGIYLLAEDTSEIIYACRDRVEGLGSVGSGSRYLQGFHLHSTLAMRWPGGVSLRQEGNADEKVQRPAVEILGLADQQYYRRKRRKVEKKRRYGRRGDLESDLWEESIHRMGPAPADGSGVCWIRVCDRGSDIFEHMSDCQKYGYGFVLRAAKNRVLEDLETGKRCGNLFETAQRAKPMSQFQLFLRARPGQPARTATLSIAAMKVALRAPQRLGHGPGFLPPIVCHVVRVYEPNPPPGVPPLQWVLLTDQPIETFEDVLEVVLMYSTRWVIEEFHKAIKTGCGAERLQLQTGHRLYAAIAVMALIALRLIHFREQFRVHPDAPADRSGLDALEIRIVEAKLNRKIKTVKDVALAVGRLGGHMNRKADGMPGWLTLWRGMAKLQILKAGVKLQLKLNHPTQSG